MARKRRAPARRRRRSYRRNPDLVKQLMQGGQDALGILTGKAIARTLPTMIPQLPKTGVVGLAVQGATAVLAGYLAADVLKLPRDVARMILAGGLSAPLETAAVAYRVPFLAPALDPVAQTAAVAGVGLSGFARPRLGTARRQLGAYVPENAPGAQLAGYANQNGSWQPWMQ